MDSFLFRRFHIVNPTNGGYEFVWDCADGQLTNELGCLTPRGHVAAGKKAEVTMVHNLIGTAVYISVVAL